MTDEVREFLKSLSSTPEKSKEYFDVQESIRKSIKDAKKALNDIEQAFEETY